MGRRHYTEPEQVAEEQPAESAAQLPEEPGSTVEVSVDVSECKDVIACISGWEDAGDGCLRNLRDFNTKDGAVPQGVVRPIEEAMDLEAKRVG